MSKDKRTLSNTLKPWQCIGQLLQEIMEKNVNGSNDAMNELRDNILYYRNYCYGWCYTWNADPGCLEDEDSIREFKDEIEANEIVEITDPYEREIALSQLDCDSNYEGPVYQAGGVKFITNL